MSPGSGERQQRRGVELKQIFQTTLQNGFSLAFSANNLELGFHL